MVLPAVLNRKIVDFLISLPNVNNSSGRQALLLGATLDEQLQGQISFSEPLAIFFELLVPQLAKYGQLEDGRNALEAVLESAKSFVGQRGRKDCEGLIQQLRVVSTGENINYVINLFGGSNEAIEGLLCNLTELTRYHNHINELKELHNLLHELHKDISQFRDQIERWLYQAEQIKVELLRIQWRPCRRSIFTLKSFAETIEYIWQESFREDKNELYGPPWVIKIIIYQRSIESVIRDGICELSEMYDLADQLSSICYSQLYIADKKLLNEAEKLCELSNQILSRLSSK